MANKIYEERQRYHDRTVIILLSAAILGLLYGAASYFWRSDITLLYSLVCLALAGGLGYALWWLTQLRYKLTITDKNVKFKLKPLTGGSRKISWDEIASCTLVKTPDVAKWHGSNLPHPGEKIYSLDGRNGLMIVTKDGQRYFIGCQNIEDLREALSKEADIWKVED